jgi:phenolic acid decarboxylase
MLFKIGFLGKFLELIVPSSEFVTHGGLPIINVLNPKVEAARFSKSNSNASLYEKCQHQVCLSLYFQDKKLVCLVWFPRYMEDKSLHQLFFYFIKTA